jgi:hypothetical protein
VRRNLPDLVPFGSKNRIPFCLGLRTTGGDIRGRWRVPRRRTHELDQPGRPLLEDATIPQIVRASAISTFHVPLRSFSRRSNC